MSKSIIYRNIYYYDLYTNNGDKPTSKIISLFFSDLFESQKNEDDYKNFLAPARNGNNYLVIVDKVEDTYIEFRMILCRQDDLPFIEKDGKLECLEDYINSDQNIAEISHCVYFKNNCIMGIEYNFWGCRPTAIADYIMQKGGFGNFVHCAPKINMDAYNKLITGQKYSLFDFAVKSDSAAYTEFLSKRSVFSTLFKNIPDTDTFEIILKKRKLKRKNINESDGFLLPLTIDEMKELLLNFREDIIRFKVSQGTFKEKVDLLKDKFVCRVELEQTAQRTIDSKEMYEKIYNFFIENVEQYCDEWMC